MVKRFKTHRFARRVISRHERMVRRARRRAAIARLHLRLRYIGR